MVKQNEIIEPSNVFNEKGSLLQQGWARKPILKYNKENIGKGGQELENGINMLRIFIIDGNLIQFLN